MSRLRPGMARVEFYAIWNEVSELLDQGHTYRSAYDLLSEKKKITMKYDSFRRHIKSKFVKKEYAEIDNQEKFVVSSANNIKKLCLIRLLYRHLTKKTQSPFRTC